jgi:parallel beta-helix repeat protein
MHFCRMLFLCCALALLFVVQAFGQVEVGSCSSFTPVYPTIQSAVNASSPGTTIYVCPGTYPEQVRITINLTIQGLGSSTEQAAIVTVPAGGIPVRDGIFGTPVAPQIYIADGADVTVSNLVVDGNGNNINTCAVDPIGIYFQNASGTVTRSAVLNEVLPAGYTGCQSGEGIFAESSPSNVSNVNVNNSIVENYQKNGITGNEVGTTLTATGNTIVGQGSTTGAAENGVQIAFGAAGSISSNFVADDIWGPDTSSDTGDAASGILVYASNGVSITSNTVTSTQFGIAVVTDPVLGPANSSTITSNTVNATQIFDAIDVCGDSNLVKLNTINGAAESGIHLDDSCTGSTGSNNTVKNNTVTLACAGILEGPGTGGNTFTGGTYYNVGQTVLTGSDTCSQFPSFNDLGIRAQLALSSQAKTGHPSVRPAKH